MSPSNADYRPIGVPPTEIDRLFKIIELHSVHYSHALPSLFDAALAEAIPEKLTSWQGGESDGYDTPSNIGRPYSGLMVKKYGRTTGITEGIVTDKIAVAKPIEYKHNTFSVISWFKDIWAVVSANQGEPFSLPGDSGSLVITPGNPQAIGIIFAGGRGLSYMIPLLKLSNEMGFQLVSNHAL